MDIRDKAALITGGKRIGLLIAEELARHGANVALSYARSRDEAEDGASRVRAIGRQATVIQADLSSPDGCRAAVTDAADTLGRLDILINMASVYAREAVRRADASPTGTRPSNVDLRAAFLCAQAAVPHMRAQGGGRIVNFARLGRDERPAALSGFCPVLRRQGRRHRADRGARAGARCRTTSSSTPSRQARSSPPPETSDEEFKAVEEATPLGRWGGELEIAKAVLALLDSDFITGETIRVDGGRHLK